ncbi:UDP-N-acetylmuramate--L-alanine ligase [Luteitalea sp. TBR-22]|uniref:UDP-N-acetylmuramate--L-alanine ligase n=1 Tax=Luteitalea sp. TBR-22 TaxID=2802971 RepID=UPI001AF1814F|nr:UDP-N-acetylmuramate--L-alanine ligase [Luteitalea sp. TBR-22]BCS35656.1 UDP-N-acetylmuramate--L-alanine ligase [Luteitalea sp. TBR-22]
MSGPRHVHFVGIGGIGMSGIAELLVNLGYVVSGSDARSTDITRRLASMGVRVHEGHDAAHVGDAHVVVVTSAARQDNPEIVEARRRGVPVIARAEMLAELMRLRRIGIAIGGAHGKTTTTSMVALMLERAGLDPTAVIGGRLSAFGSNARLGQGDVIVAEADESDGSFLKLSPVISVITNVDREHLDHYGTFERALDAFVEFANKVPFDGAVVVCADDPVLAGLLPRMTRTVVTYATDHQDATLVARDIESGNGQSSCTVWRRPSRGDAGQAHECLGRLTIHVPGRHNLRNALAAVGVGLELDVPFDRIVAGLAEFRGAERRLQVVGERAGVLVVDDYGHHPTEIAAVVAACREAWSRRLVLLFQPHRYTRTAGLMDEFADVLARADQVCLLPIYAASEDPLPGISSAALAERITARHAMPVTLIDGLDVAPDTVAALARPGDLVVTLGAGSVGSLGPRLLDALGGGA